MLGICGTTVVTEFYGDSFLAQIHRNGKELPIRRVVSLALDVIRGLQASVEMDVARAAGIANFARRVR